MTEPADQSVGHLLGEISADLSTLMRQELELAKAELKEEGAKAGKAAGMLGAAGYAGHLTLLFLSLALWGALESLVGWGWGGLIVAALWGIVAAVLGVIGRNRMREVRPKPEQTVDTLQQVPDALKPTN
jgi:uncharacterized membrane protein YqjE